MSRLEQLIAELCPNGVEYKALGEIGTMVRGNGLQKKDFTDTGVGCIHYGQIYTYYGAFAYKTKTFVSAELAKQLKKVNKGDLVIAITSENVKDVCKCVAWLGDEEIVTGGHSVIFKHNQDPKYLSYCFQTSDFFIQKKKIARGTKVIEVSPQKLEKVVIPLPPLPVQQEIVRILDKFTELKEELTAQLTAELTAKRKQYEYYRNLLLTFGDEVEWKPLGEEFPLIRNGFVGTVTPYFTDKEHGVRYLQGTNIHNGVISDNEVYYVTKEFHQKHIRTELKADDIVMVQSGHVGESAVVGEKYKGANCHALIVMSNGGRCDSRFVNYYFQSSEGKRKLEKIATGGTVKHILASKMKRFLIPVPPIDIQKRIADVLDYFSVLYIDMTSSLTAEIEARQKQYEYYRDKLLSFKEVSA